VKLNSGRGGGPNLLAWIVLVLRKFCIADEEKHDRANNRCVDRGAGPAGTLRWLYRRWPGRAVRRARDRWRSSSRSLAIFRDAPSLRLGAIKAKPPRAGSRRAWGPLS